MNDKKEEKNVRQDNASPGEIHNIMELAIKMSDEDIKKLINLAHCLSNRTTE